MNGKHFDAFRDTVERRLMHHPVVVDNAYTAWFAEGPVSLDHLRRFTVQFSVFSNQFLLAALNRVINADTLEAARESKEILLNELGVVYNDRGKPGARAAGGGHLRDLPAGASGAQAARAAGASGQPRDLAVGASDTRTFSAPAVGGGQPREPGGAGADGGSDPAFVAATGTVDGGTFRFQAAHFEWLLRFGAALGLGFADMGKRRHGDPDTLFFCDELFRLYGSADYNEAMGASFAVENWAAAGFWKELIRGLERIKAEQVPALPLGFFTWHDQLEENHCEHVWHELRACYDSPRFNDEAFIAAGVTMLDAVKTFWDGLHRMRTRPSGRETAAA